MTVITDASVPGLRRGVILAADRVRGGHALLYPEGVLLLNGTAVDVLARCDGRRSVAQITADLRREYDDVPADAVRTLLGDLAARHLITGDGSGLPVELPAARVESPAARVELPAAGTAASSDPAPAGRPATTSPRDPAPAGLLATAVPREPVPVGLLAELTYRCPLACGYCSNPVEAAAQRAELDREQWYDVLEQASALGVLQTHFSGGEPLLRRDLSDLVARATRLGLYTNLITSGLPLRGERMAELAAAGLRHVQLSIQDSDPVAARRIAGLDAIARKEAAAASVRAAGLPLTVNVVLHALNVDRLLPIAELAVSLGAERLELAHTQFYGWGLRNRAALLPSAAQIERAGRAAEQVRHRFGAAIEIVYVLPDLHTRTPKPCMQGWGNRQLVVTPNGDVLPCLAAAQLPGLPIANAAREPLAAIWYDSPSFNRYRGTSWLPEPCRGCAFKEVDLGGCRCQAYQITGDPGATDPVCVLSPDHARIDAILAGDNPAPTRADATPAGDNPAPALVPRRFP